MENIGPMPKMPRMRSELGKSSAKLVKYLEKPKKTNDKAAKKLEAYLNKPEPSILKSTFVGPLMPDQARRMRKSKASILTPKQFEAANKQIARIPSRLAALDARRKKVEDKIAMRTAKTNKAKEVKMMKQGLRDQIKQKQAEIKSLREQMKMIK